MMYQRSIVFETKHNKCIELHVIALWNSLDPSLLLRCFWSLNLFHSAMHLLTNELTNQEHFTSKRFDLWSRILIFPSLSISLSRSLRFQINVLLKMIADLQLSMFSGDENKHGPLSSIDKSALRTLFEKRQTLIHAVRRTWTHAFRCNHICRVTESTFGHGNSMFSIDQESSTSIHLVTIIRRK